VFALGGFPHSEILESRPYSGSSGLFAGIASFVGSGARAFTVRPY
jgi:hypothetical protein